MRAFARPLVRELAACLGLAVPELGKLGILRSSTEGLVSAAELRQMRDYLARPGAPKVEIVEKIVGRRLRTFQSRSLWLGRRLIIEKRIR